MWVSDEPGSALGFYFTAALFEDFPTNRNKPAPAYCFWIWEGPNCHREIVPFRYVCSKTGRDELFAEVTTDGGSYRAHDEGQLALLRASLAAWEIELRGRGVVARFIKLVAKRGQREAAPDS